MQCRGFQFREGETYHEDEAKLCKAGFHACEAPLDVFKYYAPAGSVYHEVELENVSDKREDDSKMCAKTIKVGAEINVLGLVKAQIEYVKSRATTEHTDPKEATAGDSGAATAGDSGAATAGNYGAATAGYRGAATAGYRGAATAGDSGAATAGNYGAATAGDSGAATAGDSGAATSRGKSKTGENGVCVARGENVMVCGGIGTILVAVDENSNNYDITEWKVAVVDGEKIKANAWYKLENGEFVEVEDNG